MRTVCTEFLLPSADADDVYARLCDFERYAEHTDAVREVRVEVVQAERDGRRVIDSNWSVNFRNGILCWAERDTIDPGTRTIAFTQTEGDFEEFTGDWAVQQIGGDVGVWFAATFDLGMPSLASLIEPIAERTLRENIDKILRGLLGDRLIAVPGQLASRRSAA